MSMREPPKPYGDLSMGELADWVDELDGSVFVSRVVIHMTLAEVHARLGNAPEADDARRLESLRMTLDRLLQQDDRRSMGGSWYDVRDDMPPRGCGGACMCSIERLEEHPQRSDRSSGTER